MYMQDGFRNDRRTIVSPCPPGRLSVRRYRKIRDESFYKPLDIWRRIKPYGNGGFGGICRAQPVQANRCDRGCVRIAELINAKSRETPGAFGSTLSLYSFWPSASITNTDFDIIRRGATFVPLQPIPQT